MINSLIIKAVFSVLGLILFGFVLLLFTFWIIHKQFPGGIESIKTDYPWVIALIVALFSIYWILVFYLAPAAIVAVGPKETARPIEQNELVARLREAFSQQEKETPLFYTEHRDGKLVITWSREIFVNQLVAIGEVSKRRMVLLTFDEKTHTAYFIQKVIDKNWNGGITGFHISGQYFKGLMAEFSTEYYPSFSFSDDGLPRFEVKNIRFSSGELLTPIERVVTDSGWTIRAGLVKSNTRVFVGAFFVGVAFFILLWLILPYMHRPGSIDLSPKNKDRITKQTVNVSVLPTAKPDKNKFNKL